MTEALDWARVPFATLQRDPRVVRNVSDWVRRHEASGHAVRKAIDGDHALYTAHIVERTLSLDTVEAPDLATQMGRLRGGTRSRPWQPASIKDALSVPAIYRAVSLIANTTGSLSMKALRDEVEMAPQDRPRIIVRPDPNLIPRDFYRDTAWSLATRGETWWNIAARDRDRNPTSVVVVPAREIRLEPNLKDRNKPVIHWLPRGGTDIWPNEDFRQLTLNREPGELRGIGPLQACGAAVSVAVESQEWAANFFATGGYPSIWVKFKGDLSGSDDEWSSAEQVELGAESEVERFKLDWISTPANTPKITDDSVEDIKQFDINSQGAQMLDARNANKGDAANMFGIPGPLLSYSQAGSSLTYQNIADLFMEFVRTCLRPNYLEPIEQTMSDLLTRSTVARMNTEAIEAPDTKTRYETYAIGITNEIITPEDARAKEGIMPGDVENAPIPLPRPIAIPKLAMRDVRCPTCKRLVIRASGPVEGWCRHCKAPVAA